MEPDMFLIRTTRHVLGTSCAISAMAHLREMQRSGQPVVITNFIGRNMSLADLQRQAAATDAPSRH